MNPFSCVIGCSLFPAREYAAWAVPSLSTLRIRLKLKTLEISRVWKTAFIMAQFAIARALNHAGCGYRRPFVGRSLTKASAYLDLAMPSFLIGCYFVQSDI